MVVNSPYYHEPVLLPEVMAYLAITEGGRYIDGTLGMGGHAEAILQRHPDNELLGIDRDPQSLIIAQQRLAVFGARARLAVGNYSQLQSLAQSHGWNEVDGVLLDLGISTYQIAQAERGFSYQLDGPLDMRMNRDERIAANTLVNTLSTAELTTLLRDFGEEPQARRIALAISRQAERKPLETTMELMAIIKKAAGSPKRGFQPTIARCFQALRIAVNEELHHLSAGLQQAINILRSGGRLAVISFHSLEDRMVKEAFRYAAADCVCPPGLPVCRCDKQRHLRIITKKPLVTSSPEVYHDKRPVAAKMRVAEKL